ncbi:MAG: BMC domain-containing protein [Rhizobacter sp.]|nr:BMC domain-containing protein [Chlorobiales bacterium]
MALGLIETRGLVAAIEAADAAVKAADVKLISKDRVDAGLVTIKLVGEIAAVQSAVDAGAAAAKRIGMLVGAHIIPRPDPELNETLIYIEIDSRKKKAVASNPVPANDDAANGDTSHSDTANGDGNVQITFEAAALSAMTVEDLRRMARKIDALPIQGREISRASKDELIAAITAAAPKS